MNKRTPASAKRRSRQLEFLEPKMLLAGDLTAQWRADDLNATLDDQAVVSKWADTVAAIDGLAIGQPILAKQAIGGRSAIRFAPDDGTDGFTIPSRFSPMSGASDYTVVVAFATSAASLQGTEGDWYLNSGLVDANVLGLASDWGVTMNAAGKIATGVGGGFGGSKSTIYSEEAGLNDGQLHVIAVTRQQANLSLFVDNELSASTDIADSKDRSLLGMAIGTTFSAPDQVGFEGDIAEVRIYNGSLTTTELTGVYDEINGYYNNAAPVAVADTFTMSEDAGGFDVFIPAGQGVLVNDTDAEGDDLKAVLVETAQYGQLSLNPDGSFIYDSEPDFFGTDTFTYTANDFRPSSPVTVTINVTPAYDPAVPAADQYKLLSGTVLNVGAAEGLLINDLNLDQSVLQAEVETPVSAGLLNLNSDGSFTYDPQGFAGRATFGYRINDGTGLSTSATVTLIVNTPPVANDDVYQLDEDTPLITSTLAGVRNNDTDAEGDTLSATLIGDVSNGTLVLVGDGSFNYVPDADYFGTDQFTYRLSDGEDDSNVATARLTIRSVNDTPATGVDTYFSLANTSLNVLAAEGVLQNDRDTEGDALSALLVQDVDQGSLTFNSDGSFTYVPPVDFTGVATFTYRADDGQNQSDPTIVEVAVNSLEQQQQVVMNEVHVDPDIKTERVEFIELYNRGTVPINLAGWRLRNAVDFKFPAGASIAAGGYVVVTQNPEMFAAKFGRPGFGPWDGKLRNEGETIELWSATGETIDEVDYRLGFPWPTTGEAPGPSIQLVDPNLANDVGGNWIGALPTPGEVNSVLTDNAAPAMRQVTHSPNQPNSNQAVTITALVTDATGVQTVNLDYQLVNPGDYITQSDTRYDTQWTTVAMHDDGVNGDAQAGDGIYSVVLSAELQQHRRLVRYRVTATDTAGASRTAPYADDPQPNFAYYVYDQIPAWTGAAQPGVTPEVTYSSELLQSVPVYQLITTRENHVDSQFISGSERRSGYTGSDYLWEGTLVYDGAVYDHIGFRARGGVWRYAMGKNMWKFNFERGHEFQARDAYGNEYKTKWDKLNFSSMIQQGNFLYRGEQGLFESVGFKLFDLAGVESPETQYVQFRIVADADEVGADQYSGDFQGLYLAIEQPDGNFLDEHDLPDGNFYKIEGNRAESTVNQSATQVDDASDVRDFINEFRSGRPEVEWWEANLDLDRYYAYQAIAEAIHHYDVANGKNFYYYNNPETGKWQIQPWDLDLTWADNMFGSGNHEFNVKVAKNANFNNYVNQANIDLKNRLNANYQNVVREIMDLLYNPEQTGMLIDQMAAIVYQPGEPSLVDADRAMWDYNPVNAKSSRYTNSSKNATRFHFYDVADTGDFAGMIQLLKDYVESRRTRFMERRLLTNEENIPDTPTVSYTGPADFSINSLAFTTSAFQSPIGAEFVGMKWRIAEVTDPNAPGFDPYDRTEERKYEIDATWESDVLTSFDPTITIPGQRLQPGRTYRVRVRMLDNDNHWSHWSEPIQFTATAAVDIDLAAALRISEVNYNPHDATVTELAAGVVNNNDFEFLELVNISNQTIDVTGATLDRIQVDGQEQGVEFVFADGAVTQLAPGSRLVVVENLEAFQLRYGSDLPVAGQWSGRLSNGSETITLSAFGAPIQQFAYDDAWYDGTDGDGATLEIRDAADPDLDGWNQAVAWQASEQLGGTPGRGTIVDIPGDANRDGIFNSSDLVLAFAAGEYEDAVSGNSTWEEGDWDGDGDFTSQDIIVAFQFGAYTAQAQRPATSHLDSLMAAAVDELFDETGESRQLGNITDKLETLELAI